VVAAQQELHVAAAVACQRVTRAAEVTTARQATRVVWMPMVNRHAAKRVHTVGCIAALPFFGVGS